MFYRKNICIKVIETALHKPREYLHNKLYGVGQISELGYDVWTHIFWMSNPDTANTPRTLGSVCHTHFGWNTEFIWKKKYINTLNKT